MFQRNITQQYKFLTEFEIYFAMRYTLCVRYVLHICQSSYEKRKEFISYRAE